MGPEPIIRVLLVDDHELIRAGVRRLLEDQRSLLVIAECDTGEKLMPLVTEHQPDIVVLDGDDECALDLIQRILQASPTSYLILLTKRNHQANLLRAVALGAQGIVSKHDSEQTLVLAIEKVYLGEVWINRSMVAHVLNQMRHPSAEKSDTATSIASLTPRELEVVQQIATGMRNSDIATELHISESTVGHHLSSIYNKLGVTDRLELAIYAFRHRLVDLPH